MTTSPPLRYLAAGDVVACMPPLPERLGLAERTLVGLVEGAELPPKIGVHPRPAGSFAHAMPAYLPGPAPDGSADLVGMKWIAGVPGNPAAGLPALHAVVVVNDPRTGVPVAILDGGPITAERTAAVSGTAIARWAPPVVGRARTGAGLRQAQADGQRQAAGAGRTRGAHPVPDRRPAGRAAAGCLSTARVSLSGRASLQPVAGEWLLPQICQPFLRLA